MKEGFSKNYDKFIAAAKIDVPRNKFTFLKNIYKSSFLNSKYYITQITLFIIFFEEI